LPSFKKTAERVEKPILLSLTPPSVVSALAVIGAFKNAEYKINIAQHSRAKQRRP